MALGSTVTGKSKFFWDISLQTLDSSGGTHARTYTQSRRAESTVERLLLNSNWLLTGLFSSNRAVQIHPNVSLKMFGVWGLCSMPIANCTLAHVGFFWGNPCKDIHPVKTSGIDCRKIAFEQQLASYWPVFLQSSCSDSPECKFENVWGSKICAIGMEHKLIHGQWVQ